MAPLSEEGVQAVLQAAGIEVKAYYGTPWTEIQDRQAFNIQMSGGGTPQFERAYDQVSAQITTRSDQYDPSGARSLAQQADDALLNAVCPLTLAGAWVISVTRIGGPPHLLQRDSAHRFIFTANYLFLAARTA